MTSSTGHLYGKHVKQKRKGGHIDKENERKGEREREKGPSWSSNVSHLLAQIDLGTPKNSSETARTMYHPLSNDHCPDH